MLATTRITSVAAVALFGAVAIASHLADARPWPATLTIIGAVGIALVARALSPREAHAPMIMIALLAFAIRAATGAMLFDWSVADGRGGFVTGDDEEYFVMARAVAGYVVGVPLEPYIPPFWAGHAYILGTWVYLEAGLFVLLGPDPRLGLVANAFLGALVVPIMFDVGRRIFGGRSAVIGAVAIALWPSLVLWSGLNLKDPISHLLVAVAIRETVVFHSVQRWRGLGVWIAALLLVESVRRYLFVGLALIGPLAAALPRGFTREQRVRWCATWGLASALLIGGGQAGGLLGPGVLSMFETTRTAMTLQARTAFAERPAVGVRTGSTFVVVAVPSPPRGPIRRRRKEERRGSWLRHRLRSRGRSYHCMLGRPLPSSRSRLGRMRVGESKVHRAT